MLSGEERSVAPDRRSSGRLALQVAERGVDAQAVADHASMPHSTGLLGLQGHVGNQAVLRLLRESDTGDSRARGAPSILLGPRLRASVVPQRAASEPGSDGLVAGLAQDEFLTSLRARVERVADELLARIGQTSENCPYIDRWFAYYKGKDGAHVEEAARRYSSLPTGGADELLAAVEQRVRDGFGAHLRTGSLEAVPDVVRDERGEPAPLDDRAAPTTLQRCCDDDSTPEENAHLIPQLQGLVLPNACPAPGDPVDLSTWTDEHAVVEGQYPIHSRVVDGEQWMIAVKTIGPASTVVASSYAHTKKVGGMWFIKDFTSKPPFGGLGRRVLEKLRERHQGERLEPEFPSPGAWLAYEKMGYLDLVFDTGVEEDIKRRVAEMAAEARSVKKEMQLENPETRQRLTGIQEKIKRYESDLIARKRMKLNLEKRF